MKKTVFAAALIMCLVVVFGCKSQPQTTEEALKALYDRYRDGLILDGASSYTVVRGDTLSSISRTEYSGDGFYYPLILLASSDIIVDEDKLLPGMQLTVPNLQRNLDDPSARATLKSFLQEVATIEDNRKRHATANGLRAKAASL